MRIIEKRAALALSCIAVAALTTPAYSKPHHHYHRVSHRHLAATATAPVSQADSNTIAYPQPQEAAPALPRWRPRRGGKAISSQARMAVASRDAAAIGGLSLGGSGLVAEARRYLGTNPTGRRSLWCANFMNLVLERSGYRPSSSNLARSFASYGYRVSGPQVGAIAVMGRRGGGHVGVVTGVDAKGNPILISGNHNRTVAESVYPRGRIYAYVMPN